MVHKSSKIVIINSHSDNRGDEAAQRAMIDILTGLIPNARFTLITRTHRGLDVQKGVEVFGFVAYSKSFPFFNVPFVFLWLIFRFFGIELSRVFKNLEVFKVLKRISDADLVISAPGGPYIGDLYKAHEISEHLLQIFIAKLFRKPVMIYGPSMGPFNIWWRNLIRRYILNKVEIISLRDLFSREYLKRLKLAKPLIYVTADSAFQSSVELDKVKMEKIIKDEGLNYQEQGKSTLIGVTPAGFRCNYRDAVNQMVLENNYSELMAKAVDYMASEYNAIIVFIPQLYGRNTDMPLIKKIISLVEDKTSARILSGNLNSDVQQAIISRMDMMVGNRYHSAIFALKALVPTVCIAYEHKSTGVMKSVDMEAYLIDIKELAYAKLIDTIQLVWELRDEIRYQLTKRIEVQKNLSFLNSLLTRALLNCVLRGNAQRAELEKEVDVLVKDYNLEIQGILKL